jgi:hypothetical protein
MKMKDAILFCVQCDAAFTFSSKDQERFLKRGFDPPRRCPLCRQHKIRMVDQTNDWKSRRRANPRNRFRSDDDFALKGHAG